MVVAAARVTLYLEDGHSLKEKRRFLKSLVERLRAAHEVSLSEVDAQELWQKAVLGLSLVAPDRAAAEARLARALADVEALSGLKHIDVASELLQPFD